jgi:cholesterol oxidase
VYGNTLPKPTDAFFEAPSWRHLASWKDALEPHYATARRMLGAAQNPQWTRGDEVLGEIARDLGREEQHHPTDVAVYFGTPGKRVPDPYFDGAGPERAGCTFCGACMTGCRVGAKNTLDRNYLYLAEAQGLEIRAETEVTAVRALPDGGYRIETRPSLTSGPTRVIEADRVVLSGGVMGTVPLLLKMKGDPLGLPELSTRVGSFVRTNSEALVGVVTPDAEGEDFSKGVAITSILHTDDYSHVEPVRYASGSGFFRVLSLPYAPGSHIFQRLWTAMSAFFSAPLRWLRALTVRDFAKNSQVLLYMRTLDGTLSVDLGRDWRAGFKEGLVTRLDDPASAPQAFMEEATELVERFAEKVQGVPVAMVPEMLSGVPTTAHILGGACMGADAGEGVIDAQHRVHGHDGLYVIDGSAMSANPGVNPSLTITAMAERAMSFIPRKDA